MRPSELQQILDRLITIEAHLAARGALVDVTQAIEDNVNTFGLIAQLVDIYKTQRDDRHKQAGVISERLSAIESALATLREEIHGVTPEDAALLRVQAKGEGQRTED